MEVYELGILEMPKVVSVVTFIMSWYLVLSEEGAGATVAGVQVPEPSVIFIFPILRLFPLHRYYRISNAGRSLGQR